MIHLAPARVLWCTVCPGERAIDITCTTEPGGEDLSTVTGGYFHHQLGAHAPVLWAATVVGTPTARAVVLRHVLVRGDLTSASAPHLDLTPLATRPGHTVPYSFEVARLPVTP